MKFKKKLAALVILLILGLTAINGFTPSNVPSAYAAVLNPKICTVNYAIQYNSNNYSTIKVTIANTNTFAINGWTLSWTFPGNQKIIRIWNGSCTQSGATVKVSNTSSNTVIRAGGSVTFQFMCRYSGKNQRPSSFTLISASFASSPATTAQTATPRVTATATPRATTTPASTPTVNTTATTRKTFYTSSVNDGLNANDRVLFDTYFKSMGYTNSGSSTDIKAAELNTILSRSDIGILYHTGHGYDSGIATSGNYLSVDQVSGVNVSTAIFATCQTLTSTTWKNKMNSSCNNIFGYTNYSYDSVDDDVVKKFASNVKSGKSMIQAWYSANIASSYVGDRWCGYVRENNRIVEYSARTSNTPKAAASTKAMNSAGTLKVATNLLADNSTYDSYFFKIRNSEIKVKGSKTHDSKFYNQSKIAGFLPKVAIRRDKAITLAKKWVSGSLPSDAVQDSVTQIVVTDASGTTTVVGQVVRYARYLGGLAVRTNGSEDHLAVLVNSNGVSSVSRLWPTLETRSKPGAIPANRMLSLNHAIEKASSKIAKLIKANKTIVITDAKPCYGTTKTGTLVPAYELIDSQGGRIIINAITADLVF